MALFSKLFARRPSARRTAPRTTLNLECLEAREVPAVTYHGGAVLGNVEAQAVYLGSNWSAGSPSNPQTGQLDTYVKKLVNSPFLDVLGQDGYGVGRGTASGGIIDGKQIDGRYYLTDGAIRQELQSLLSGGYLQAPDSNRLYIVFVEPGVAVKGSDGGTSDVAGPNSFLGYHTAFTGYDAYGSAHAIRYAVVTYPGAGTNNFFVPGLNAFDTVTKVASHEIAEAVTDPDVNYAPLGWYDDQLNGEVGDITNGATTRFAGYAVQLIADRNDNPTALPAYAGTGIVASSLAYDRYGRAVVDVIYAGGALYQYDAAGGHYLGTGFQSVSIAYDAAGNEVLDVVYSNGLLFQYDSGGGHYLGTGFKTASVAFDRAGNEILDVVYTSGLLFQYDAGGAHYLGSGFQSVSVGIDARGGEVLGVVYANGAAYQYNASGGYFLGSQATSVSLAIDAYGRETVDLVFSNGDLYFY
jgi:hypothetical protein